MSDIRITTNGVRITIHIDVEPIPHHYDLDAEDQRYQEEQREANRPTDAELEQRIMEASAEELAALAGSTTDEYEEDKAIIMAAALLDALGPPTTGAPAVPDQATVEAAALFTLGAPEPAQVEPLNPPEETVTPEMAELRALQAAEHTETLSAVRGREWDEASAIHAHLAPEAKRPAKTKASPKPPAPDPDEKLNAAAEESKKDRMLRSELALKIPIGERHLGVSAKERVDGREQFGHCQTLQKWTLADLQTYYDHLKDAIRQKETK